MSAIFFLLWIIFNASILWYFTEFGYLEGQKNFLYIFIDFLKISLGKLIEIAILGMGFMNTTNNTNDLTY